MKNVDPFPIWLLNAVGFVACVIAFTAFGDVAGYRTLGLLGCIAGAVMMYRRSIPVGIEGRPASFFITGAVALIIGFLISLLGLVIMISAKSISGGISWTH